MPAVPVVPLDAAEIVRAAISAGGGFGEPWCLDGAGAVRVGQWLFVVEVDDLGWVLTAHAVDGGEATPVVVLAAENTDPVRTLADWLRRSGQPLTWRRVEPGRYRCGDYLVGQLDTGEWFAEGPGVDRCFDHKSDAQAACAVARGFIAPISTASPKGQPPSSSARRWRR